MAQASSGLPGSAHRQEKGVQGEGGYENHPTQTCSIEHVRNPSWTDMCLGDTQVLYILPKIQEKYTKAGKKKNSKNENKESED